MGLHGHVAESKSLRQADAPFPSLSASTPHPPQLPPPPPLQDWKPEDGVRVHTICRETGGVRVWQLPCAFFAHHEGNAYDTEGMHLRH